MVAAVLKIDSGLSLDMRLNWKKGLQAERSGWGAGWKRIITQ